MSRVLGADPSPPYLLAHPGDSVPFEGVLKSLGHWHLSVRMSWVTRHTRIPFKHRCRVHGAVLLNQTILAHPSAIGEARPGLNAGLLW